MTQEEERVRDQWARLQQEHRDLDAAITALQLSPARTCCRCSGSRNASYLRDRISFIEDELTPTSSA